MPVLVFQRAGVFLCVRLFSPEPKLDSSPFPAVASYHVCGTVSSAVLYQAQRPREQQPHGSSPHLPDSQPEVFQGEQSVSLKTQGPRTSSSNVPAPKLSEVDCYSQHRKHDNKSKSGSLKTSQYNFNTKYLINLSVQNIKNR